MAWTLGDLTDDHADLALWWAHMLDGRLSEAEIRGVLIAYFKLVAGVEDADASWLAEETLGELARSKRADVPQAEESDP